MPGDLERFADDLNRLAKDLDGAPMRQVMSKLGVAAKTDAADASRRTLGADGGFSGWPRLGALQARYSEHREPGGVTVHRTPRSAGGWRVAEEGRNQAAGPPAPAGRVPGSRRTRRRWNGRTHGLGTWTDVEQLVFQRTPARVMKAVEELIFGMVGRGR